jgi:hypothetical protein
MDTSVSGAYLCDRCRHFLIPSIEDTRLSEADLSISLNLLTGRSTIKFTTWECKLVEAAAYANILLAFSKIQAKISNIVVNGGAMTV